VSVRRFAVRANAYRPSRRRSTTTSAGRRCVRPPRDPASAGSSSRTPMPSRRRMRSDGCGARSRAHPRCSADAERSTGVSSTARCLPRRDPGRSPSNSVRSRASPTNAGWPTSCVVRSTCRSAVSSSSRRRSCAAWRRRSRSIRCCCISTSRSRRASQAQPSRANPRSRSRRMRTPSRCAAGSSACVATPRPVSGIPRRFIASRPGCVRT
jgi:hypothetical protein